MLARARSEAAVPSQSARATAQSLPKSMRHPLIPTAPSDQRDNQRLAFEVVKEDVGRIRDARCALAVHSGRINFA